MCSITNGPQYRRINKDSCMWCSKANDCAFHVAQLQLLMSFAYTVHKILFMHLQRLGKNPANPWNFIINDSYFEWVENLIKSCIFWHKVVVSLCMTLHTKGVLCGAPVSLTGYRYFITEVSRCVLSHLFINFCVL